MCIAIMKPAGIRLSKESLENSWNGNPDGAGFMYPDNGKVVIVKGLMTFDKFMEAYEPHQDKQCALHFRIATHGGVTPENTHPFAITESLGLVHNGIINNIECKLNPAMSDTWHFTEIIMKKYHQHWQVPEFKALTEAFIGFSKLILLDGQGDYSIYNEKSGSWDCGCWFSNNSYKTKSHSYSGWKKPQSSHTPAWDFDKVAIGDFRRLLNNEDAVGVDKGSIIAKGSLVEVETFGHGVYVWVVCREVGNPMYGSRAKVSCFCLAEKEAPMKILPANTSGFEVEKEVIFSKNYNHFRIGDKGIITSVSERSLVIKDLSGINQDKHYYVPKTHVQPVRILLN